MKKKFAKPSIKKVTIDNEISMVMMSFGPGGDPGGSIFRGANSFKWLK
jgi:hypothetical protein